MRIGDWIITLAVSAAIVVPVILSITQLRKQLMSSFDDINARLDALTDSQTQTATSVEELTADVTALKRLIEQGQDPDGSIPKDKAAELLAKATAVAERGTAIATAARAAADLYTPTPPVEPPA